MSPQPFRRLRGRLKRRMQIVAATALLVAGSLLAGLTVVDSQARTKPARFKKITARKAKVIALTRQLAKIATRYESAKIYEGGRPSQFYARFTQLRRAATDLELRRLLRHRSAIIRAYVAAHMAIRDRRHIGAVYPLLRDKTVIVTQQGCMGARLPLANFVVNQLCAAWQSHAVHALLRRAAADRKLPRGVRKTASLCVSSSPRLRP